ncbi:hypothetical protein B0T17DRAFT_524500 [Bombardia bombarda]|uniref:Uncharacterized protein n=1 Tax=Bombardia bombarda TaxID=252184 RepID=A0AA39X855_9PEZI|nr:hypothetical protein B0T17DRAFT_524500 [Bombardia bombarda]
MFSLTFVPFCCVIFIHGIYWHGPDEALELYAVPSLNTNALVANILSAALVLNVVF